ncbi:amino acid ABC transporter permease [Actinocrispum wychmicini]|uniref:Polar amino acid transport system permease protein n=1 Tax=Actinocrispum wychmicini TaxID=1213861 RepID=A0A4R2JZJ8_9PSEU|nr:amino acid ABC transporter permease [Actinocrispum wychmicini]TCO64787.1 polar amino acid transport system permease protein [Actinocrispum wychmicini]
MSTPTEDGRAEPIKAVPVRHVGRWVAGVIVLALAALAIRSIIVNPNFHWDIIGPYLFDSRIADALLTTLRLTLLSMIVGVVGGVVLAVMRLSPNPLVSGAAGIYIWLFRGTPLITQLIFWAYLGALYPTFGLGIPFGPEFVTWQTIATITVPVAAVLGLGLNEAAYMSEIVRAGIQSIDEGQTEAASALGMTRGKILRRIVLPQAMRVIIPPTGNQVISMLKTTSLVVVIGEKELMVTVGQIYAQNFLVIPLLIVAAIWYLVCTSVLTVIQGWIERKFARGSTAMPNQPGWASRMFAFRFSRKEYE